MDNDNKWEYNGNDKTITFYIPKDPEGLGVNFYKSNTVTFKPGLTVLVGCNGAGKTTLLKMIYDICTDDKNIGIYYFKNLIDGGSNLTSKMMDFGDTFKAAGRLLNSEGENIFDSFRSISHDIGVGINKANKSSISNFVVLLDGIDSGLSIDNIIMVKDEVLHFIPEIEKKRNNNVYIIVSANEFELAYNENCYDVVDSKYVSFNDYESYKEFIIKSGKKKDLRDKKISKMEN